MTDPLLQCVLARDSAEAALAWRAWRASTDIDSIQWRHALMVPMVREDLLQTLIAGDEAAPILNGLVRRAWTQGSMRAALAHELAHTLVASGIGPVVIGGSVAAFLHRAGRGPIRPVTDIVLLVPRQRVHDALRRMRDLKWVTAGRRLPPKSLSWTTHASMHRERETLRIGWRHVGTPPWRAIAAERELFARPREVLPVESLMLSRLSEHGAWPDTVPWQADVAVLASHPVDWDTVLREAGIWAPNALARLGELRGTVAAPPRHVPRPRASWQVERALWRGARAAILTAHRIIRLP